jgi:hypothetical protein
MLGSTGSTAVSLPTSKASGISNAAAAIGARQASTDDNFNLLIASFGIQDSVKYLRSDIATIREEMQEMQKWTEYLTIAIIALSFLVLVLLVIIAIGKVKCRSNIVKIVTKSSKINEWLNKAWEIQSGKIHDSVDTQISGLEETIRSISDVLGTASPSPMLPREKDSLQPVSAAETLEAVVSSNKMLYANAIIDDVFFGVTDNPNIDTVYELFLENQHVAKFTIYKDSYSRVIACPDLLDGCNTKRMNNDPNSLKVEKGIASLQENGKWQIAQKAEVKFV